ncbi:haloacid dehalogenase type II [Saccharopolyspora sp. 5N708]|uniref:haloacid dehalogenase type II n=1 Tax=Saccharopolyspora sp. 5N708 TaxID=3457424 RepID=UPI003FD3C03A
MDKESFGQVRALTFDIFGTTFDWWTGVTRQVADISRREGVNVDAGSITDSWRDEFFLAVGAVRTGEREWAHLDILHGECLDRVIEEHGLSNAFDRSVRKELVRSWHRLPAWPDVATGLERLRSRFTLSALSNGGFALTTNLVKHAGLPFDCILSAQLSRHYKPDIEVYRTAVELLDLAPEELMMVAAHSWDLAGARAAGFRTAYVARPRERGPNRTTENPAEVECDVLVEGFDELATVLNC